MTPAPRPAVLDTRLPELPARKACACREGVLCLHARPEAGRWVYVCSRCSREERVELAERRSRHSPWPREPLVLAVRSEPARAGNTGRPWLIPRNSALHPRARGENTAGALCERPGDQPGRGR